MSRAALELAIAWNDYLKAHAQKVYAAELNSEMQAAHTLAEKIRVGDITDGTTIREIYRHKWPSLDTAEGVFKALEILETHHWIRSEQVSNGVRPKEVIRLHPVLTGQEGLTKAA